MEFLLDLIIHSARQVWVTLLHNWPFLALSVGIATLLKLFLDAEKVSAFMQRYRSAGVVAATTAAVATPLCSCGTTAVILGMLASTIPWGPVVAFMVASPLTSPQELVYSAGLFGWPFALAFFLSSIFLGLAGGWLGGLFESQGWLKNQARLSVQTSPCGCSPASPNLVREYSLDISELLLVPENCECASESPAPASACAQPGAACSEEGSANEAGLPAPTAPARVSPALILKELYTSGSRLLVLFLGFAFLGYFLNGLIPESWVAALFGSGSVYSVPLAATFGLPLYINTEASLPLVRALLDAGMSQGAALAFLISGAGTSVGAIGGALTIARWRVVGLVIAILWVGAVASGYLYDLALALTG